MCVAEVGSYCRLVNSAVEEGLVTGTAVPGAGVRVWARGKRDLYTPSDEKDNGVPERLYLYRYALGGK